MRLLQLRVRLLMPSLLVITNLITSNVLGYDTGTSGKSIRYNSACGPSCIYATFRSFGLDANFVEIAEKCEWCEEGRITVADMVRVLDERGELRVTTRRISFTELSRHLDSGGVAILVTSSDPLQGLDHVIAVVCRERELFRVVDFPNVNSLRSEKDLAQSWQGEAILVSRSSLSQFRNEWYYYLLPIAAAIYGLRCLVLTSVK